MVNLDGLPLNEHAAALQQQLDALKRALDDPNAQLDLDLDDAPADDTQLDDTDDTAGADD